jgi:hypothetical protein
MKRVLAFFFFICAVTISITANTTVRGSIIDLTCTVIDPRPTPVTRAPQIMPCVSVEGNTLFLNNSFFQDIVVEIQDNQGDVVYCVNVPFGINSIVIPTTVSDGEYQLFLKTSTLIYEGTLILQ